MKNTIKEISSARQNTPLLNPVRFRTGIDRIHLETALSVHLHGSFRKAAVALGMKASTVNRRIRDLEFQLGTPVFERQKRRLAPTPSGLLFLRRSGEILQSFHTLVEGVRRVADGRAGQIAIGYHGAVGPDELYDIIFKSESCCPDIRHVPMELAHDRLFDALAGGAIDAAIVRGNPATLPYNVAPLWTERLVVVLSQRHELSPRPYLQWSELVDQTFLISAYDPSEAIRGLLEERFAHAGMTPNVEVHQIGMPAIMHMVGAGRGICLCLDSISAHSFPGTVVRELSGSAGSEYVTSYVCWREDNPNPAFPPFLRSILRRYRETKFPDENG